MDAHLNNKKRVEVKFSSYFYLYHKFVKHFYFYSKIIPLEI